MTEPAEGILIVNKEAGMTSADVVARVRRISGIRRVGHTGTLDPFATGVLPVCTGRATAAAGFMLNWAKRYRCGIRLGYTTSTLDKKIGSPYQLGDGDGPGGWIILVEPEVKLGENIVVPDLGGWKSERFPQPEETNWISIAPDWACEVLSPGTLRLDRVKKMPLYGQFGVSHFWMIDPVAKTLEVFRLESGRWSLLGAFSEDERVRAEPFLEIEIDLSILWLKGPA